MIRTISLLKLGKERAKTVGMPERFAQQALGHSSKAIARAYSKKAQVIVPSLEDYERKIVPMPRMAAATVPTGTQAQPAARAVNE